MVIRLSNRLAKRGIDYEILFSKIHVIVHIHCIQCNTDDKPKPHNNILNKIIKLYKSM